MSTERGVAKGGRGTLQLFYGGKTYIVMLMFRGAFTENEKEWKEGGYLTVDNRFSIDFLLGTRFQAGTMKKETTLRMACKATHKAHGASKKPSTRGEINTSNLGLQKFPHWSKKQNMRWNRSQDRWTKNFKTTTTSLGHLGSTGGEGVP